jgi:hypothetical protein
MAPLNELIMTRAELKEKIKCYAYGDSKSVVEQQNVDSLVDIMEDYAEEVASQQSIAFAEWLDINSDENDIRSSAELYAQFIEHQTK